MKKKPCNNYYVHFVRKLFCGAVARKRDQGTNNI